MSFSYISNNTDGDSNRTYIDLTYPVGATTDDLCIALLVRSNDATVPNSTPSGWTLAASLYRGVTVPYLVEVWYRVKTTGESNPSWGWALSRDTSGFMYVFRDGFDTSNPIADTSSDVYTTFNGTIRAGSVDAVDGGGLIFLGCLYDSGGGSYSLTPPSGFGLDYDLTYPGNSKLYGSVSHDVSSSTGATGNLDGSFTGGSLSTKHAIAVALNTGYTDYHLTTGQGSFSYSGASIDLYKASILSCSTGSFSYSGASINLIAELIPLITNCDDEDLSETETGVLLDGFNLSGSVVVLEIGDAATYGTCVTLVEQTINSNSGTQIDFDVVLGLLDYGSNWLYITVDGVTSDGYGINIHQADPVITGVSDSTVYNGQNITVTGSGFGATQSSSKLNLYPLRSFSNGVEQFITSWSDTEITLLIDVGDLSNGTRYLGVVRNNSSSGDLVASCSNLYSIVLIYLSVLSYKNIVENGGGKIAHLWHVGGYPWAVTDTPELIDALSDTGQVIIQKARKRLFGNNSWTQTGTIVPAYTVPIFPGLIRWFGDVKWDLSEVGGIIEGGNWSVRIEDRVHGYDWPHTPSGDISWGLEGLTRVVNVYDSTVHGWAFIGEAFLRNIGGATTTEIYVNEQSANKLYSRIDATSGDEFVLLWINHECVAVNTVDGSYPNYNIDLCDFGVAARGLYHSRPQDHFMGSLAGVNPIMADVPGSIVGKYCWLYSIPLDADGQIMVSPNGEPMIVDELRGVISPNISTVDSVTTVPIRSVHAAAERRVEIENSEAAETQLAGFVFCRGNVESYDLDLIRKRWQQPHLSIVEYVYPFTPSQNEFQYGDTHSVWGDLARRCNQLGWWEGDKHVQFKYYSDGDWIDAETTFAPWRESYIWICGENETVTFETAGDVIDALNAELAACYDGSSRHSKETRLFHKYKVNRFGDRGFVFAVDEHMTYVGKDGKTHDTVNLRPMITGPLAWVFNLGVPIAETENIYTLLSVQNKGDSGEKTCRYRSGFALMETCEHDMVLPLNNIALDGQGRWWMKTTKVLDLKEDQGQTVPRYYYTYPWVDNAVLIPDRADSYLWSIDLPVHSGNYSPPKSEYDGTSKFYLSNSTDLDAWNYGEPFTLGKDQDVRRLPLLTGAIDSLVNSNQFNLKELVSETSLGFNPSDSVLNVGFSLFHLPLIDGGDFHAVSKALQSDSTTLSHVFRALLGESMSGIFMAKEIQHSACPFFTDDENFLSCIDWDSLDALPHPVGNFSIPKDKITDNIFDLLKDELLFHGATMTREFSHSDLIWKFRFKQIDAINVSEAKKSGLVLRGTKMVAGAPEESNGIGEIYNGIEIKPLDTTIITTGSHAVGDTYRRILKIDPSVSVLNVGRADRTTKRWLNDLGQFFGRMLRIISTPTVEQSKDITIMQNLFPVGREVFVIDSTARLPFTHELGLSMQPVLITGCSYNHRKNTGTIRYRIGNGISSLGYGYAPAAFLEAGNFTKSVGSWSGYPNDHEFTAPSDARDVYFFDCFNLSIPDNPAEDTECGCDDYKVWAIEIDTWNWTPLPFTCSVDGPSGLLTLTGDTTEIDTTKDYVIIYRGFDDLETCQKYWVVHADDNNTIGTDSIVANRWV